MSNKAFISYSHSADLDVAPALQRDLQRFAKPLFKARAFTIFRDTTNLAIAPELWPEIETALAASEFLIFLASPPAARSSWVSKEIAWWLEHKSAREILIVVTSGELEWNDADQDFDHARSTAIPKQMHGAFKQVPLYLDFRTLRTERLSLDNPNFIDSIATIAARLHARPKDELYGEHIRQHRRVLRIAVAFVVSLMVLALIAYTQYSLAERRRAEAERQFRIATARRLAVQSQLDLQSYPERSLLLATEAWRVAARASEPRVVEAEDALRRSLASSGGYALGYVPDGTEGTRDEDSKCELKPLAGLGFRADDVPRESSHSLLNRFGLKVGDYRADRLVSLSSDSKWILALGVGRTAHLWNIADEVEGSAPRVISDLDDILSTAFSPDGRWLVTGAWTVSPAVFFNPYWCRAEANQTTLRLWNLRAERQSAVTLKVDTTPFRALAIAPNGRWLAAANEGGALTIWDLTADDPSMKRRSWTSHNGVIEAIAITSDSKTLVSTGDDQILRIWPLELEPHVNSSIRVPHTRVRSMSIAKHDRYLCVVGSGSPPRLVSLLPPHNTVDLSEASSDSDWCVFSNDGRWVVTGGRLANAHLTSLAKEDFARTRLLRSSRGSIRKASFSQDNQALVTITGYDAEELADTGEPERTVRVWRLGDADPTSSPLELNDHTGIVFDAAFDREGVLITASADRTVRLWHLNSSRDLVRSVDVLRGHEDEVFRALPTPDGKRLVSASLDGRLRLWNMAAREHRTSPIDIFDGDSSVFATNTETTFMFASNHLWDLRRGYRDRAEVLLPGINLGEPRLISPSNANFSKDGRWFATVFPTQTEDGIALWDLSKSLAAPLVPQLVEIPRRSDVLSESFSTDGRWYATVTQARISDSGQPKLEARLFDLASGEPRTLSPRALKADTSVASLAFSPDGRWLASWSGTQGLCLWKLETLGLESRPLVVSTIDSGQEQHRGNFEFSPSGDLLLLNMKSSSAIWNLRAKEIGTTKTSVEYHHELYSATFSENEHWLIESSSNGYELRPLTAGSTRAGKSILLPVEEMPAMGHSLIVSPDDRWAVSSQWGKLSRLWNLKEEPATYSFLTGHRQAGVLALISEDSRWLVTADSGDEHTCRIWDLSASAPTSDVTTLPDCDARALVFTKDGRELISSGRNGIRVWPLDATSLIKLAENAAGRALYAEESEQYLVDRAREPKWWDRLRIKLPWASSLSN